MAFDSVTQTMRRAAQVARIAAAAKGVSRAPSEAARLAAQNVLAAHMADARGLPLKVGQLMGTLGYGEAFTNLARGVPARPLTEIGPAVEAALGTPLESVFSEFDDVGIAASLGQVHKARLHTGEYVAVKVRYPDIVGAIDAEMRLAKLLPGLGPVRKWGFDLGGYKRILADDLSAELDYDGELKRQVDFAAHLKLPGLVVPSVYPEYSSESLLVQSWEAGIPLDEVGAWSEDERQHVAVILLCTLFKSLFVCGAIHGDPHLGNYRFRRRDDGRPEVILLDYGCVVSVPQRARLALLKLVLGAIAGDRTDPLACFHAMGFSADKLAPIQDLLPALSSVLAEPFTTPAPFSTRDWPVGKRVDALLGDLKWWFRAAGPPEMLLLIRAFHGIMMQLELLQISLPWQQIFFRVVGSDVQAAAKELALPAISSLANAPSLTFEGTARYLKIQIQETGRELAFVTMPATQVIALEELIPVHVREKLLANAIDLAAIRNTACASGLVAQTLFAHSSADHAYRVWLE